MLWEAKPHMEAMGKKTKALQSTAPVKDPGKSHVSQPSCTFQPLQPTSARSVKEKSPTEPDQPTISCCCWEVASVMSDSVQPHRRQPTRLSPPQDSPGKNSGVDYHFLLQCMKVKSESEVAQSCPTLSDPMDCSPPGSSVHGIFQARVLEWGAIAFSDNSMRDNKIVAL